MSAFPTVVVKKTIPRPGDEKLIKFDWFSTVEPVVIEDYYGHTLTIPKDYTTDGTSSPRMFWWLVPPMGKSFNASVFHDWAYDTKLGKDLWGDTEARKKADAFFKKWLEWSKVPKWQIACMMLYVRILGNYRWKRKPKVIYYNPCEHGNDSPATENNVV